MRNIILIKDKYIHKINSQFNLFWIRKKLKFHYLLIQYFIDRHKIWKLKIKIKNSVLTIISINEFNKLLFLIEKIINN